MAPKNAQGGLLEVASSTSNILEAYIHTYLKICLLNITFLVFLAWYHNGLFKHELENIYKEATPNHKAMSA